MPAIKSPTGQVTTTQSQLKPAVQPGRPALPSQLAPVRPQPVQPTPQQQLTGRRPQSTNPFMGGPGRGPMIQPGAGGGMMQPQMPGNMPGNMPGQMVPPVSSPPPTFNLPSPVPVLGQIQPGATNLNTTPGQLGNQVPPPAPGMQPAAPLGSAPASIGADTGYQNFIQTNPDFVNQYGQGDANQAYDFYTQQMAQAQAAGPMGMMQPGAGGGIMGLPALGGGMMGPMPTYGATRAMPA